MIRTIVMVAVFGTFASGDTGTLKVEVQNVLTPIDSVPSVTELDATFSGAGLDPLTTLSAISQDTTQDVGIRLRAIHALASYCTLVANVCPSADPAHQALVALISVNPQPVDGSDLLVLRAAIEAIGSLQVPSDFDLLPSFLSHSSRDVRATTATALGDLCLDAALMPLRARYLIETTDQVRLAISAALTVLGQCGT